MKPTTATHARSFQACVESAHPFNLRVETSVQTLRKRAAWLLNERETGMCRNVHHVDPAWLTGLDLVLNVIADMIPATAVRVLTKRV